MSTERLIAAVGQLGNNATPPQVRRLLQLPAPRIYRPDPVAVALERLRQRGVLRVRWVNGCAYYGVPEAAG